MIDIKHLRVSPELYKDSAAKRGVAVDIDKLLELDKSRTELVGQIEGLRAKLNVKGKPTEGELKELQEVKGQLALLDADFAPVDLAFNELLWRVPNLMAAGTPEGDEADNREERSWGGKPEHSFETKDHLTLAEANGWIDFERGAKVAGSKFYYLKGALVKLEMAVTRLVFDKLELAGFTPMIVPNMVSARVAAGSGYLPRGEERQIYKIEGEDLNLIATSEIPMTGYYADEILELNQLPVTLAGISPAYRVEKGAYGKYSKGLYRVHQFNKVEMYVFCTPEEAEGWHDKLMAIEEEICQALEIPYRVVRIAAGDLGAPAFKKYDVEYWTPVEQQYRELMSCSNVTDFQARRLNVRYRNKAGENQFVYTLNGTGIAFSRTPIALLENHQTAEGKIRIPEALQPYYGAEFL